MPRLRTLPPYKMVSIDAVPGRFGATLRIKDATGSVFDPLLRDLSKKPGKAAAMVEPDRKERRRLISWLGRMGRRRATPVKTRQSGERVFVWLKSED